MSKDVPPQGPGSSRYSAPAVPWNAEATWGTVNRVLQHLCISHRATLGPARQTAGCLKNRLELLFPVLESLCSRSCATCQAPCCHVATVWFDYKDLVFMHLSGQALAVSQLSRNSQGVCCCCGPSGCRLPRLSRPWTCSWYLCPTQKNLLAGMPGKMQLHFEQTVTAIKQLRKQLEADFIRITS